jgi:hypothetical protein
MGNTTTRRLAAVPRATRWAWLALRVGLIGAMLAASATPVLGQEDEKAVKKIIDLNKKALAAIDARQFDVARDGLLQAVTVAKQANLLTHKMLARTYVHLGAVYFMGFDDRKSTFRYFGLAKSIRADIKLTPSLATPNLTAVFDKASAEGGSADASEDAAKSSRPRPPRAATPAQPMEPEPRPAAPPVVVHGEPELPIVLPADLYCPAVEEAPEGQEIVIRCAVKPTLKAERILLYFRASGAPSYAVAAMQNSPKGWLEASIPVEAATGESLQYYCEARDSADNVVATNGQEDVPNPIILKPAAPGATPLPPPVATGGAGEGEDALAGIKHEQQNEIREEGIHRRRKGAFWIGVGWGTGWGYHRASLLEYRRDAPAVSAGVHGAGWANFYPEVGFLITEHIGVAVQGRLEYIPIQGSGDTHKGSPANGAVGVLGRGLYYLDLGSGNAQLQFSANLGGGEYRFAYPPTNPKGTAYPVKDSNGNYIRDANGSIVTTVPPTQLTDTIRSGTFLYGAGVGFVYHFAHWVAANFELRFLGAGPHLGLLGEGYLSAQFSLGGKRPAQPGDAPPMERLPEEDEAEEE